MSKYKFSHWNYRVLSDQGVVQIIEVFYDNNSRIVSWLSPQPPQGDDVDELAADLENMGHALDLPVLTLEDLPS